MKPGEPFNPFGLFTGIFIPEAIVRSTRLSPGAKLAFGRLLRYAGQDGRCFPFVRTLAIELGIKERQTQYILAELESEGYIRRVERRSKRGSRTSNEIEFVWHHSLESSLACTTECNNLHQEVTDTAPRTPQNGELSDYDSSVYEAREDAKRVIEESPLNRSSGDCTPHLITEEEWPQTTSLIQGRFPSVDGIFMSRLVHAAVQAALSAGLDAAEVTDARLLGIVEISFGTDNVKSAGLLLKTVPQIIKTLATQYARAIR